MQLLVGRVLGSELAGTCQPEGGGTSRSRPDALPSAALAPPPPGPSGLRPRLPELTRQRGGPRRRRRGGGRGRQPRLGPHPDPRVPRGVSHLRVTLRRRLQAAQAPGLRPRLLPRVPGSPVPGHGGGRRRGGLSGVPRAHAPGPAPRAARAAHAAGP
ncbi:unnamed protein product, partial [Gulo gulo]